MSPNIEKRQFRAGKSNQQLTLVLVYSACRPMDQLLDLILAEATEPVNQTNSQPDYLRPHVSALDYSYLDHRRAAWCRVAQIQLQ